MRRFTRHHLVSRFLGPTVVGMLEYYRRPELRAGWGGPMNGQRERQRMVVALLQRLPPDAIVETGSYRGTTTAFLARRTRRPVFTVECDQRMFGFTLAAVADFQHVRCFLGDSRRLLTHLAADPALRGQSLFCYLDAHGAGDLPLAAEVDHIFTHWPRSVVLIDDFKVPDDSGYGYDNYGPGHVLTLDYLAPSIARFGLHTFFPAAPATQEIGGRRGCVVLGADADVVAALRTVAGLRELAVPQPGASTAAPATASPRTPQQTRTGHYGQLREGLRRSEMLKARLLLNRLRRTQALVPRNPDHFLKRVSGVIHIGANAGQERSLYDSFGLRVLWVEAIPDVYRQLVDNVAQFPLQKAVHGLVTDQDDQSYTFHVSNNEGLSSSILPLKHHRDIWPDVTYSGSVPLRSTTLPTLLQNEGVDLTDYNALIMDTQGSELLILKGAEAILRQFMFIKTEVPDFESYAGCAQLDEMTAFLERCGFREYARHRFASRQQGGHYYDVTYQLVV